MKSFKVSSLFLRVYLFIFWAVEVETLGWGYQVPWRPSLLYSYLFHFWTVEVEAPDWGYQDRFLYCTYFYLFFLDSRSKIPRRKIPGTVFCTVHILYLPFSFLDSRSKIPRLRIPGLMRGCGWRDDRPYPGTPYRALILYTYVETVYKTNLWHRW